MRWQYRVDKVKTGGMASPNLDSVDKGWLDQKGQDGWELVSVVALAKGGGMSEWAYYYWKRAVD